MMPFVAMVLMLVGFAASILCMVLFVETTHIVGLFAAAGLFAAVSRWLPKRDGG